MKLQEAIQLHSLSSYQVSQVVTVNTVSVVKDDNDGFIQVVRTVVSFCPLAILSIFESSSDSSKCKFLVQIYQLL
jgi:Na+/serine symporter